MKLLSKYHENVDTEIFKSMKADHDHDRDYIYI